MSGEDVVVGIDFKGMSVYEFYKEGLEGRLKLEIRLI